MAGIQTVDSSGKVALALMGIDNQIKSGDVSQAKFNMTWLQNELSKMKLMDANREIQQKTSQLNSAIADRRKAEEKVQSLTAQHNKDLFNQKVTDLNARTTDWKLMQKQNIDDWKQSQSAIDAAKRDADAAKTEYENKPFFEQNQSRDARVKELSDKAILTEAEQTELSQLRMVDMGGDAKTYFEQLQQNRQNTLFDSLIQDLNNKQNRTPVENAQLYMMQMASVGQLHNIKPETLSMMFQYNVTEEGLNKMKQQVQGLLQQSKNAMATPEPSLSEMRQTAQTEAGVPMPAGTPPPAPQPTAQQRTALSDHYLKQADAIATDAYDIELNRTSPTVGAQRHAMNLERVQQETELSKSETTAATERFKSQPDSVKELDYLIQNARKPGATETDRRAVKQALDNMLNAGVLEGNALNQHVEYLTRKAEEEIRAAQHPEATEEQKQIAAANAMMFTQAAQRATEKGVPTAEKSTGTSSSKAPPSLFATEMADRSEFEKAVQNGRFENVYEKLNADPDLKGMSLPTGVKIENSGVLHLDAHQGIKFDPKDPKASAKSMPAAIAYMNALNSHFRAQGYSPQKVLHILNLFDGYKNELGANGQMIPKESPAKGHNVAKMIWTYGNIVATHGDVVRQYRNRLTQLARRQPVAMQQMAETEATDTEKVMQLWQGFDGWDAPVTSRLQPTNTGTPSTTTTRAEGQLERGGTFRMFDQKKRQFVDTPVDRLVKNAQGRITGYMEGGKRKRIPKGALTPGMNVPVPIARFGYKTLPAGTPLVINGKQYLFSRSLVGKFEVTDQDGNIVEFNNNTPSFFPGRMPTAEINRLLKGMADTSSGAKRMLERRNTPYNPMKPDAEKPSQGAQKKNQPKMSSTAASLTWETLRSGKRVARLDSQGRALATVLHLIPSGATRTGLSGVRDGDTLSGVQVELPDWDQDARPDNMLELEGGTRVELPQAWKQQAYESRQGAVYTKDTDIRLAGFFAEEMTLEDNKTLNPLGVRAQKALIRMFKQGWLDSKEQNRFIFKVRVVGVPLAHEPLAAKDRRYKNPYADKYNRLVTDVFIATGNKDVKIAELTWANPAGRLSQEGHGEVKTPWFLK